MVYLLKIDENKEKQRYNHILKKFFSITQLYFERFYWHSKRALTTHQTSLTT